MKKKNLFGVTVLLALIGFASQLPLIHADVIAPVVQLQLIKNPQGNNACDQQLATKIETAFSPEAGGEELVLKVIRSAKKTIRLSAYAFTSRHVATALVDAKQRNVDVAVVVDYKSNIKNDRAGHARFALNLLANAGITIHTVSIYPIHHDKFIIVDGVHVQTGSYNYSSSAAKRNSENVIVIWNNPQVASSYHAHWASRYGLGINY